MLMQAAMTPTDKDPNARVKAVDRVTQHLRTIIPEHFQEENDHDSTDLNERNAAHRAGSRHGEEHRQRG
jgi:hypothetical protein